MSDNNLIQSKKVYETLVSAMEELNLNFAKDEEKLTVYFNMDTDDLPVSHLFSIDSDMMVSRYFSPMTFTVPQDKIADVAVAIAVTNNLIKDGCFDFDISAGMLIFKLTTCFRDSVIGKDYFKHALVIAHITVDNYNDKLEKLSTGKMTLEEYLKSLINE